MPVTESYLSSYQAIVGAAVIEELRQLAHRLKGVSVLHVNSTAVGGGVAEILNRMVPFMDELGVDTSWKVIKGDDAFYAVTKKIHNALQGQPIDLLESELATYDRIQEANINELELDADIVFIHDPQPLGFVRKRSELRNKWIWRCHIDVSKPHPSVWRFLQPFVERYDWSVFTSSAFAKELSVPQSFICPSIDAFSEKNRDLPPDEIWAILHRLNIPLDKPLVTQVSRFDRMKDPVGVIQAFHQIKDRVNARLLMVGGSADDDPEGAEVLLEVQKAADRDPDILILSLPPTSHLEINAIQRASTVIIQKSLKEGFGLTITEALWKAKPVIAGAVGGIPLQITHERSGVLTRSVDEAALWMQRLLEDPALAQRLGQNGRQHVLQHFLLTRHIREYLELFCRVLKR